MVKPKVDQAHFPGIVGKVQHKKVAFPSNLLTSDQQSLFQELLYWNKLILNWHKLCRFNGKPKRGKIMKIKSNTLKSISVAAFIFAACQGQAQQIKESMALIPKQSSESYLENLTLLDEKIQNSKTQIEDAEKLQTLFRVEESFKKICADQDFADQVVVINKKDSSMSLTYTCFDNYDDEQGKAFIFEIGQSSELVSFSEVAVEKEISAAKKQGLKLIFKESVALVASSALTYGVSKVLYPGELDKLKHATISSLLGSVITASASYFFKVSPKKAALIGISGCGLIGIAKEIYDSKRPEKHTADIRDFGADMVGCTVGSIGMKIAIEF